MSLLELRHRVEDVYLALKGSLNRRRAVVTSVAPLQIRFELSDEPLAGTPDTQVWPLMVGDLVHVLVQNRRALIIGKVRGAGLLIDLPSRGTSAQRVELGLSGAATEGMTFYDTDENREYVWRTGEWRRDGFTQQDVTEPIAVAANGRAGLPVTFPEPFTDIPMVTVAQVTPGTNNLVVDARSVTNSGFVVVVASLANAAYSPTVRWTAVGVG